MPPPDGAVSESVLARLANAMYLDGASPAAMPATASRAPLSAAGAPSPSAAAGNAESFGAWSPVTSVSALAPASLPDVAASLPSPSTLWSLPASGVDPPDYYFLRDLMPAATPAAADTGITQLDGEAIRRDFPALQQEVHGKRLVWLDNAATTQKPQSVIDALSHFYEHDNSNVHRAAHTLAARATDAYEGARQTVQRFLGARSSKEIIFVRGATEAINLVAQTFGRQHVGRDDEILLTTLEHHANIVPWQMLAREKGARLRVAPIDDAGQVILDEYAGLLSPRTRVVALAHVSNALGTVLPLEAMTQMAHRYGAVVVVDGAQAVSHLPVDVQTLDADFYALSGHKLFGPTGAGVLYGKEALLDAMPPWQGGGSMIKTVSFDATTYNDLPTKFEAGTPTIGDAVGLRAAIDYVSRIGMDRIVRHEQELITQLSDGLNAIRGLRQIGTAPGKVGVASFVVDWMPTEDMGRALDAEGIAVRAGHHCAQPTMHRYGVAGTVRPSLALYNTADDIDRLLRAIRHTKGGRP